MFVISMKPNTKRILVFLIIGVMILLVVMFVRFSANVKQTTQSQATASIMVNNEQRRDYLKTFGWDVSDEPVEIADVVIPEEFGDVYNRYNKLQKEQGFDLEKYKGKLVKRYTYSVKNYPNEPEYVRANLLIINGQIIGGDISSLKLNGFMHGFKITSEK